jgi:hypothetical protein
MNEQLNGNQEPISKSVTHQAVPRNTPHCQPAPGWIKATRRLDAGRLEGSSGFNADANPRQRQLSCRDVRPSGVDCQTLCGNTVADKLSSCKQSFSEGVSDAERALSLLAISGLQDGWVTNSLKPA